MYRSTPLGDALAAAIELTNRSLGSGMVSSGASDGAYQRGFRLTADQEDLIWRSFDTAMEEALDEVPTTHAVEVVANSTGRVIGGVEGGATDAGATVDERGKRRTGKKRDRDIDSAAPGTSSQPPEDPESDEDGIGPLYRCIDGVWTIVLRRPRITVGRGAVTQTLQPDWLKIVAAPHDIDAVRSGGKRSRRKGARESSRR